MTAGQRHNVPLSRHDMFQRRDLPEDVDTGEGRQYGTCLWLGELLLLSTVATFHHIL